MIQLKRRPWLATTLVFLMSLCALGAHAQGQWPNQPIKLIVPFPTGGTVDQITRLVQPHLQQVLGQSVVIDNRAGASGSIGTAAAAKATPDGYTWVMVFDTHGVNPSLIPNMPFDTLKDLTPVMLIGKGAMVVTAHSSTPYKTFNDMLQAARSKPGAVSYGTIGSGSLAHLAMTSLGAQLKADWGHIPYKGGGPLSTDGIAGHVPVTMATYALWAPHIASGRLRALAVTSPKRMAQLPDVPTLIELGAPDFEAEAWWGMLAPAGMPADIVQRMNAAMAKVLKLPPVQERLVQMGVVSTASSPDEFGRFIRHEVERWSKVVKEHNIKAGQ
jgi:tripartite-type tricarboxylate transporter receptor subunit TctC